MADGSVETHPLTHDPLIVRPEGFFFCFLLSPAPSSGWKNQTWTHTHTQRFCATHFFRNNTPF